MFGSRLDGMANNLFDSMARSMDRVSDGMLDSMFHGITIFKSMFTSRNICDTTVVGMS